MIETLKEKEQSFVKHVVVRKRRRKVTEKKIY